MRLINNSQNFIQDGIDQQSDIHMLTQVKPTQLNENKDDQSDNSE
ncbi:hypothetical protein pb186bvf_002851 [Paramecium bursaria]